MAHTSSPQSLTANAFTIRDTAVGATADANVAVGAGTLYELSIDNSANAAQTEYLKLYNNLAPTVGTTAPDMIIPVAGGATVTLLVPEGVAFGTSISVACVQTGGTGGTASPSSSAVLAMTVTAP